MINIELSDGSVIQELEVNGNCLISENNIKNELLTYDMLSEIVIDGVKYKNILHLLENGYRIIKYD